MRDRTKSTVDATPPAACAMRRSVRGWVLVCGLVLVLAACAGGGGTGGGAEVRIAPDGPRVTGLRAYLVAGMAAGEGDPRAADFYLAALADDPDNARLLRQAFLSLVIAGRMKEAAGLAERLSRGGEGGDLATLVLTLRDFRRNRTQAARRTLDKLEARGFEQLIRPVIEAWLIARQGDRDAALRALAPLDRRFGLKNHAKMERAFLLDYFGEEERAAIAYKALVYGKGLTSLQPVKSYAALLQRMGRTHEAKAMLDDMRRRYPNNDFLEAVAAALVRGERLRPVASRPEGAVALLLFRSAGDLGRQRAWRPAIVYARLAAWLAPRMSDVHLRLGALLSAAGYHRLALRALDRIPASDPLYPRARRQQAWVYRQAGEREAAIAALEEFLVRHPEDREAWMTLGDMHRVGEEFAEAAAAYSKAMAAYAAAGETPPWYLAFSRGVAYERLKDWERAEADLRLALSLKPDEPQVLNYLGYSWIDRGIRLKEGTKLIERAVELAPDDGYIVDSLGWAWYLQGRYDKAVETLERAILLVPDDPVINDHLGDAYWKVGRRREARFQWAHALALDPDPEVRTRAQAKLRLGLERAQSRLALALRPDGTDGGKPKP